jgi:hypothetical protein
VSLDLVAVAAAVFLLCHVAGSVRSVTMPLALRSVLPGPAASRAPGSRAMHSSNRAWLVRTLQLGTLKNGHDFWKSIASF